MTSSIWTMSFGKYCARGNSTSAHRRKADKEESMYGVRHGLAHEFPEYQTTIHDLKSRDPDFAGLLADYDATDKKIYGIEQQMCPVADNYIEDLKKKRLLLKDRLYAILKRQS